MTETVPRSPLCTLASYLDRLSVPYNLSARSYFSGAPSLIAPMEYEDAGLHRTEACVCGFDVYLRVNLANAKQGSSMLAGALAFVSDGRVGPIEDGTLLWCKAFPERRFRNDRSIFYLFQEVDADLTPYAALVERYLPHKRASRSDIPFVLSECGSA
jgi:hypothetical protein